MLGVLWLIWIAWIVAECSAQPKENAPLRFPKVKVGTEGPSSENTAAPSEVPSQPTSSPGEVLPELPSESGAHTGGGLKGGAGANEGGAQSGGTPGGSNAAVPEGGAKGPTGVFEGGAGLIAAAGGGVSAAILHPVASVENFVGNVEDAMSGGSLGASTMRDDPILNPSARAAKQSPHMLDDGVSLPGEEPFPPRIKTVENYPNPLEDPLGWWVRDTSV